jgi:hypothetical protein
MKAASRFGVFALGLLALALMLLPAVRAGEWDHATNVTFNNSVQLPGVVLAPGDYRFEKFNSQSNRHIIQVFNRDHSHVFGTFFTVPKERLTPVQKTEFVMEERPFGEPPAIKEWWYPGELIGDEFIYSKKERVAVAAVTSTTTEVTLEQPAIAEQPAAPVVTEEAAPAPAAQEPYQEPAKAAPAAEPTKEEELPKTASNVYLFLLIGSMTILSGAAIRRFAKS